MKAILRNARITPKKANLIAGMVRGKPVQEALNLLKFMPKKGAAIVAKVLRSASANATNNFDQKEETLNVKSIVVNAGTVLKRGIPISRGQWHPILKRNSHIAVEVGVTTPEKKLKNKSEYRNSKQITNPNVSNSPLK